MASSYSPLKIQLMATGENNSTWGNVTNVNLGTTIEEMVTRSADVTFASANVTLTLTDTNATQTARNLRLNLIGTTGGARNLIVPATEKVYIVNNTCADDVTVKNASGTGTVVPAGRTMWVYNDATNVVDGVTALTSLTLGTGANALSGVLKGNGTSAVSAATAGTDYVAPNVATTFTALQTFSGSTSVLAAKLANAKEVVTLSASGATGTINYDATTQSVVYLTNSASANWTVNIRASSGTALNAVLSTGECVTVCLLATQGATAYYNSIVQVDGTASGVTVVWPGGAPSVGGASGIDSYLYTVVKTGSAAFTIFASVTSFR